MRSGGRNIKPVAEHTVHDATALVPVICMTLPYSTVHVVDPEKYKGEMAFVAAVAVVTEMVLPDRTNEL